MRIQGLLKKNFYIDGKPAPDWACEISIHIQIRLWLEMAVTSAVAVTLAVGQIAFFSGYYRISCFSDFTIDLV